MSAHISFFRMSMLALALSGVSLAHAAENGKDLPAISATGKRPITNNWKTNSERNISSMRDLLADRADINAGGGNASAQYLSIRAAGQNRIDMVVDGTATATQLWYHQGRFQLDPDMVRVIGVDKGAGSASAGIGMTSGAIRSQTLDAKDLILDGKPFGARISTQYNSNKSISGSAAVYANTHGFDALLLGSWHNARNYKAGRDRDKENKSVIADNTARKQANYLAKFGYEIHPDHKIGISYRREHFYGDSSERPEFASYADRGNVATTQQTVNARYAGKNLGFINSLDANVFHIKGDDERENWQRREVEKNGKKVEETYNAGKGRHSQTFTTGANLNAASSLLGKHTIKYGLNWRNEHTKGRAGDNSVNGERKNEVGIYAEGIWSLDPVTLTTGLRYDHFELNTVGKYNSNAAKKASVGAINPSVGVIWDVMPDLALHAKLNYASRSPNLASAYTLTDNRGENKARGWRDVADKLKPEQARLAEVGFNWTHKDLNVNGTLFQQQVKNYYTELNSSPVANRGTLKTNGYELGASYQWKGLTARASMAYANPKADFKDANGKALEVDFADDPLDIIPQGRQWRTSLTYRFDKPNLEVGWRGRFAESKDFIAANRREGNARHRKGYGVHDLYANWKPLNNDAMNVNVAVNNVGNKLYKSHSQRLLASTPPNPGREVRLGVNYRF
ncbi:TonB-dependent receptor domain-containing protein [Conchiformibius kuhniae]|uniref:TonB-dependent receptor domain-containing protein n=1 Tax=Conchiformibius kuhniae TaxID=211502 RepID=A0A8T9MTH5_9NEIS|nr:TonB-dependent receptor [Conchiformibius kuhniae]UOP04579.1 TonB-dependent receptor [Conchiformibius kuhniae]